MKQLLILLLCLKMSYTFTQKSVKDSVFVFYFKSAKTKVPSDSLFRFKKFYKHFESCKTCFIELKGFTDSVGNERSNLKLSQLRIDYVKTLLVKHSQSQIQEVPLGEKLSQNAQNNQEFRKVILSVKSQQSHVDQLVKKVDLTKDTLYRGSQRYQDFAQRNVPIRLNILFHLNSVELIDQSTVDIEILAKYLLDHPKVNAKLQGHVCCNNDWQLSRNRALQIRLVLMNKGIKGERLTAEGYGNEKPAVKEINKATEQINRRVEVVFSEVKN